MVRQDSQNYYQGLVNASAARMDEAATQVGGMDCHHLVGVGEGYAKRLVVGWLVGWLVEWISLLRWWGKPK